MEPQNTEDNTRGFAFIKAHELPYVDHVPHDGRSIVVKAYYDTDGKQFYAYSLQPNGMLLVLRPMDVIGTYVARSPAKDLDSRLPFSETILHYFSFSEVCHALTRAEQDLLNGLASLHKYFVLLHYSNQNSDYADDLMVRTEVEYAFANHRAFYDCLHEVIRTVHKKYRPESPQLPDSFRKIEKRASRI